MRQIDKIFAAIAVDPQDQTEGICAVSVNGMFMPLVAADEMRLAWIRETAAAIGTFEGHAIRIVEFSTRTVVEEIKANQREDKP